MVCFTLEKQESRRNLSPEHLVWSLKNPRSAQNSSTSYTGFTISAAVINAYYPIASCTISSTIASLLITANDIAATDVNADGWILIIVVIIVLISNDDTCSISAIPGQPYLL